jgi:hypothetical protein
MEIYKKGLTVLLLLMVGLVAGCIKPAETPAPVTPASVPLIKGRAFTNGHGGHIAVTDFTINPKTKEFEILKVARVVPYGTDGKKIKGKASHAVSIDKKGMLYWAALDGTITEIDLNELGLTTEKLPVGQLKEWRTYNAKNVEFRQFGDEDNYLHCGSSFNPDESKLYVSAIYGGTVLIYDTTTHQKVDLIPVDAFLCAAEVTPDGRYLYAANMVKGLLHKVDLKTNEVIKSVDMKPHEGYFLHIGEIIPTGQYLWQTAANKFKEGKPHNILIEGAIEISQGYIIIYDTIADEVVDKINVPGDPHDVTFTTDGKFAIASARHLPENPVGSGLVFIDAVEKSVIGSQDICATCHDELGVDVSGFVDPETQVLTNLGLLEHPKTGLALACGIDILWEKPAGQRLGHM